MNFKKESSKMIKLNERIYKLTSLLMSDPFFIQTFIAIIFQIKKKN